MYTHIICIYYTYDSKICNSLEQKLQHLLNMLFTHPLNIKLLALYLLHNTTARIDTTNSPDSIVTS